MKTSTVIIIGAGPAGLTAADELLGKAAIQPTVFEASQDIGGLSKTLTYKGNRLDVGPHRFFSKSDRVMGWWQESLPPEGSSSEEGIGPFTSDKVMLIRDRLTRILFSQQLFPYPLSPGLDTLSRLGVSRAGAIGLSYVRSRLAPIQEETSLEDFFINRFGRELYLTFFKDYTEKVWGVPCSQISPDWGSQRIKGLSVRKAVSDALASLFRKGTSRPSQKAETSLIRSFFYPKLGAGQMWEEVAGRVTEAGGSIRLGHKVVGVRCEADRIVEVEVKDEATGTTEILQPDYVFSTMSIRDLIRAMGDSVPSSIRKVSEGLPYRDHIEVGLLVRKMKAQPGQREALHPCRIPDNWVYIQEPNVRMGRVQVFNNWSPAMAADPDAVWLGIEYFCTAGDDLWGLDDDEILQLAISELVHVDFIGRPDVLDGIVVRTRMAYPGYFGTYDRLSEVKAYLSQFENLYLIGRNGMHRYNNMDHSVLSAMVAVDHVVSGQKDKEEIWQVNAEKAYHEVRT